MIEEVVTHDVLCLKAIKVMNINRVGSEGWGGSRQGTGDRLQFQIGWSGDL